MSPVVAVPAPSYPAYKGGTVSGDVSVIALPYFLGGRRVWVYLPPGYRSDAARRYPVLYMHDAQNLFDASTSYSGEWRVDEACEELIRSGRIPPFIVVGVENAGAGRIAEYTPWADPKHGGGKAAAYLEALERVLKPEIDRRYRTLPDARNTFMAGSSLGGLVSAYAGYWRPQVWGGVIAMSPSYWWASERFLSWSSAVPKPGLRFFYQDMGTAEGGADPGVDDYIGMLRKVESAALAQGFREGKDFFSVEAAGHNHSEASWAARFPLVLQLLFSRR
ncbi:MAG: hypothetical protein A2016_06750 [Elusimicrobia bacterium GWF2_62_30]|nr:MAG: hypothetical protein A2016_06750 [Elusimicrobia bacterium GWF2_62_30]